MDKKNPAMKQQQPQKSETFKHGQQKRIENKKDGNGHDSSDNSAAQEVKLRQKPKEGNGVVASALVTDACSSSALSSSSTGPIAPTVASPAGGGSGPIAKLINKIARIGRSKSTSALVLPSSPQPTAPTAGLSGSDGGILKKRLVDRPKSRPESFIHSGADTFADLLAESTILADKSLFIKFLFDARKYGHSFLFGLPSGSGKTMLLTMLEEFLNYEKRNGWIFHQEFHGRQKFAIMKERAFLDKHMHKYPTLSISLDMANCSANGIEQQFNVIMKGIFSRHRHLRDWMKEKQRNDAKRMNEDIAQFDGYLHGIDRQTWGSGLQFLLDLLCSHSKHIIGMANKAILLVDNFDAPILNFVPYNCDDYGQELKNVMHITGIFLHALSKAKVHMHVFMGNYSIAFESRSTLSTFSMEADLNMGSIWQQDLRKYFGFTQIEMMHLCQSYGLSEAMQLGAKEYFNGLTLCSTPMFTTASAMKMLNACVFNEKQPLRVHIVESSFFKQFHVLFKKAHIVEEVERLFADGKYSISVNSLDADFSADKMFQLLSHVHTNFDSPIQKSVVEIFFKFLQSSGYLIRLDNDLVIPNEEYKTILRDLVVDNWYRNKFKFNIRLVEGLASKLVEILRQQCQDSGKQLEMVILKCLRDVIEETGDTNESLLQTVYGLAALLIPNWQRNRLDKEMLTGGPNSKRRPDIALASRNKHFGLVAELKWGAESADQALGQIAYKCYLSESCVGEEQAHLDFVVAMGVAVYPDLIASGGDGAVRVSIERRRRRAEDIGTTNGVDNFIGNFQNYLREKYPKPKDLH